MGLLDSVLGNVLGGSGGGSPMQGVLMNLLGGGQQGGGQQGGGLAGGLGGLLGGNQQPMGNPAMGGGMGGGLGGLMSMFQGAGLGHVADSWVGTGPNQPVSPQQLQNVFGQQQVESMAQQANMQPNDFLSQLSEHLPRAVDGMTPHGRLPDEGTVSV